MSSPGRDHSANTLSALRAAFPAWLGDDVGAALSLMGAEQSEPCLLPRLQSMVEGASVTVPYRVYFPPSSLEDIHSLTERQKAIHACVMTRHRDGHQRERWARILCSFPAAWTAPFMAVLLEDYVIQVLAAARDSFRPAWVPVMRAYSAENGINLRRLNHRILTLWSLRYRHYIGCRIRPYHKYHRPNLRFLTDYPGYTFARLLGLWDRRAAPKLLRAAARAHPAGRARLIHEHAYTFGSADNTRRYPVEVNLAEGERVYSVHGVLVDDQPVMVIAAPGGATGVHDQSLLTLASSVFIAVGSCVVRFTPGRPHPDWDLTVDDFTCFGVHYDAAHDALISHGELAIARFSREGEILWSACGADIFSEGVRLLPDRIEAVDFNGRVYRFDYVTGRELL